jgi:putative transposase
MPRANRYILPGNVCHLTHRCHNRSFLFKFARDRTEYRNRLRATVKEFKMGLLTYCITSNHVHLLVVAEKPETVSRFMQKLEGEFAEYYNIRKRRGGAFWQGRYWSTMIDNRQYLWDCMKYIDLNMVRAGVVSHPSEWDWCGYRELVGERKRYTFLDVPEVISRYGNTEIVKFRENYRYAIDEAIARQELKRDPLWTESIAIGSESFAKRIEEETLNRRELTVETGPSNRWCVKEAPAAYN